MSIKILYMELLDNNYGNKRLDINLISALNTFADVTVASSIGWFEEHIDGVKYLEYSCSFPKYLFGRRGKIYYSHLNNLKVAKKLDKKNHFDYLFFSSFHSFIMALSPLILKKLDRVYILHHNNIDLLESSDKKQLIFKTYCKKVNHFVLSPFIGKHLREKYDIPESKIIYIPHPLNSVSENNDKCYDCIGISNSNDEKWIRKLIEMAKRQVFVKANLKVVLRSKIETYDDGYLTIISGYLEDKEYYHYINNAKSIFLPFPSSFKYRMSGSLVDAFSNNTMVIGTKIPLFCAYEERYPSICHTISDFDDFVNVLKIGKQTSKSILNSEFDRFKMEHNDTTIVKTLLEIFDT